MSWTYSGDPGASPLDEVRFLAGATTQNTGSPSDEEIDYLLTTMTPLQAAIAVAEAMGRTYGLAADRTVGSLSLSWASQSKSAFAIADRLRAQSDSEPGYAPIYGGGGQTYLGTSDFHADGTAATPYYPYGV